MLFNRKKRAGLALDIVLLKTRTADRALIAEQKEWRAREETSGRERIPHLLMSLGFCFTLLDPNRRHWSQKSQLMSFVAIGFQKPYAKTEVGMSCNCMMFSLVDGCQQRVSSTGTSQRDQNTWNTFPVSE
jgi:hypothetical protein